VNDNNILNWIQNSNNPRHKPQNALGVAGLAGTARFGYGTIVASLYRGQ
jgi:hypothetical protein